MIKKTTQLLLQLPKSSLFKNYIFLSVYQVVNFLVPILIVPFVIRQTGIERFGRIAFSYAFVNYFAVLTDYGFNLSATRSISLNRNNLPKVSRIFSTVIASKLLFFVAAFLIFSALLFVPFFRANYLLHLGSFSLVLAQVLMPIWLFQGLEDMKYLAIFNTISKIIFALLIITFIRRPQDFILVNFLQGLGGIVAALVCHYIVFTKFRVKPVAISFKDIRHEIKEGWVLFLSAIAVNIYVNSNAFILGLFAGPLQVGYYSIAEKVYMAIKQFNNVFSQVIFPKICLLANESLSLLQAFLKKVFVPFIILITVVCFAAFILAGFICHYFLKQDNSQVVLLIRIFSVVPVIAAFDIPPFQSLIALNKKRQYGWVLISGCVLNVLLNILLVQWFNANGTAVSVLVTELFITAGLIRAFNKLAKPNLQSSL